jgi:hypothetical protein
VFPVVDQSLKGDHHLGEIVASLRGPFYLKLSKMDSTMNKIETINQLILMGRKVLVMS